jgi:hypothetical protein
MDGKARSTSKDRLVNVDDPLGVGRGIFVVKTQIPAYASPVEAEAFFLKPSVSLFISCSFYLLYDNTAPKSEAFSDG